ncbi:MAG TPA: hypothetical protein VFF84_09885 [Sphingobium sp.]|nr:hypothetical protein [Sphingobium sp.]
MRLLMWSLTITFALAGLALWGDGGFVGADVVARMLGLLALLACPFFWTRPDGLVPDEISLPGKQRLMLGLALLVATPLILPWQLWL